MLLVLSSPDFTPLRSQIAELAISYRLPTMFIFKTYVEAGRLLSYGADLYRVPLIRTRVPIGANRWT
jgi:hypothetical protein